MSKPAPETGVENQSQPQLSEIDAASAQLQQLLEARQRELEVSIDDWDVADLLDFLQSAGEEEFYSAYELFSMFAVKPELASTFLDNYLSITDPKTKNRAKQLLTASYPGQNNIIEEKIIDRMRQGDPPDEWLDVLSDVGVFTNDSLTYLGEQLGYFAEAQQVSKAIRAINKGSDAFFNKIPRQTRETLTSQVNNHLRSTDPEVKGAALRALAAFPVENSEAILIEALSDSNTLVQRSAIASLMRGKFQDASVSDALLNLMRDENNAFDTRMLATRALRRYNLTGQDYDDLYDFSLEIRNHQQNQLRQQRQANQQLQ
ncbi:MAG: HEAT repeat domain-containing protein [Pseudomonadota bacterium]